MLEIKSEGLRPRNPIGKTGEKEREATPNVDNIRRKGR